MNDRIAFQGRCLILAEIGSVHDGSFGNAIRLLETAAECGADGVKFQTHIANAESTRNAPMPAFFKGEPRFDYFRRTGFSRDQWRRLATACQGRGVHFVSSPFSEEAVDLLEDTDVGVYKVPSGEVTNIPLLVRIAETGKPVLLSSGMSSWAELDSAVEVFVRQGVDLVVMQCTSEYPCSYEHVGLNVLEEMKERYCVPVGLSDHTLTAYASLAAVVKGASVIERHFTFDRRMYGSDARHSMIPEEFSYMVEGIRAIETMLGNPVDKDDVSLFQDMKSVFEKSIVAGADIEKGEVFTRSKLVFKKPGTGIKPSEIDNILGRRAARHIKEDELIDPDDIERVTSS